MKFYDLIIIILFIAAVIMTAWYLFSNPVGLEQGLLILIITLLFSNNSSLGKLKARQEFIRKRLMGVEERLTRLENSQNGNE